MGVQLFCMPFIHLIFDLGFELKMEKLEALMKDQATPENVLDDLIEKPTKENILQEKYFKDL